MHRQYIYLAITGVVAFGGLALVLLAARNGFYSDVMMAVFFAGSVGAVVNNYFRLSKIYMSQTLSAKDAEQPAITIQILVSPLLSGIIGFAAYGLFLSGLLRGTLFPDFVHLDKEYVNLSTWLDTVAPASNLDTAKAIMWSFVAGFSERFIPNALDVLVRRDEPEQKNQAFGADILALNAAIQQQHKRDH